MAQRLFNVETKGFRQIAFRYKNSKYYRDLAKKRMHELGVKMKKEMQEEAPTSSGKLRKGIKFRVNAQASGAQLQLYSEAKHTRFVQMGTRPHMPPVAAIAPWALAKGLSPWAVAMGIKAFGTSVGAVRRYGSKANPFMRRTLKKNRSYIARQAPWMARSIAHYLNTGRAGV